MLHVMPDKVMGDAPPILLKSSKRVLLCIVGRGRLRLHIEHANVRRSVIGPLDLVLDILQRRRSWRDVPELRQH